MGDMAELYYCYDEDSFLQDPEPIIYANAKILHETPLAFLVQCDKGIAWLPRKVAWIYHGNVLYIDWYFSANWQPIKVQPIEGDFI